MREGAIVSAESAAFPLRVFRGKIVAIERRIDPVTRAFQIRVRIPNPDSALPAGMFMRLSLELEERQNPAIPEEALVVQGDDKFVYIVDEKEKQVARTRIEIGQRRDGLVEVTNGLQSGETIVTEGTHRLRDGAKIRIATKDATQPAKKPATAPSPTAKIDGKRRKDGG